MSCPSPSPCGFHLPFLSWILLNEIQSLTLYQWLICKDLYKAAACLKTPFNSEHRYCCKSGIWEHLSANLTFPNFWTETKILYKYSCKWNFKKKSNYRLSKKYCVLENLRFILCHFCECSLISSHSVWG